MSWKRRVKTEHAGAKNSSASTGFWGRRVEAKQLQKIRRRRGREEVAAQMSQT